MRPIFDQLVFPWVYHSHGEDCFERTPDRRPFKYTPCRPDGGDRNLRNLNPADFRAGTGRRQLTMTCPLFVRVYGARPHE